MSAQNRRHLSSINESLRAQHNNLKATKDHLLDHIGGLMKREKQLAKLKKELTEELIRSEDQIKIDQRNKAPLCTFLKEELSQLDKKYIDGNLKLRNLQNQYQLCLQDYENVIETVSLLVDGSSGIQGELSRLKQSDITMKAMIFDCERLKRVLQQEKRYFRQLCNSQAKTHVDRVKELESIRKNIKDEEDTSTCSIRLSKLQIGFMKLGGFFQKRIHNYQQTFIRGQNKEIRLIKLGSKSLVNCINISSLKMSLNMRHMFRSWHNNVFPKDVLKDITQRALLANNHSKIRLQILGAMEEKIHENTSNMLHLYEKIKFTVAIANKCYRKDKHYGFNIWRENCRGVKKLQNILQHAFSRVLPKHLKREYFKKWHVASHFQKRLLTANILLNEFEKTKSVARTFRKWRFEVLHHQEHYVRQFIRRLQQQQKITKRINYQKRKIKIITTLHLKLTKIKLRNYFTKYWCNVKQMRVVKAQQAIGKSRQIFSDLRKANIKTQSIYNEKDKNLLLKIFQNFVYKCKIIPVYKLWRNESQHFKKQKRAVLSIVMRKQAKNKIYVMNEFRKCVQYYQKKEMHQVLTDLNKKMETINQKSTQFRELLKNCIENLGVIASKKLDYVTSYAQNYQQKLFFHTYISQKIKKAYKTILLARLINIIQISNQRQSFSTLLEHTKQNKKQKQLQKKVTKYYQNKIKERTNFIFQYIKRLARGNKKGFSILIHFEHVFCNYRLAYSFAALKRKFTVQKYKALHKQLQDQGDLLKVKEENMINVQNTRVQAENSLKQFFGKFINYEDRKQKIKKRQKTHNILKTYLEKFRKKVKEGVIKQLSAQNIGNVFINHNQFIFFRNLMVIRYEQLMSEVKQQLVKINKKRKTFEEKNGKIRQDIEKRIQQEIKVYNELRDYFYFYEKRYENLLKYYEKRTQANYQNYVKKQIFFTWKYQCKTVKRICQGINAIVTRKLIKEPMHVIINFSKACHNKIKSQLLLVDILEKKGERLISKTLHLWKANIYKMKLRQIQLRLQHLDDYEAQMKEEIKQRSYLISKEVERVNAKKLIANVFMGFKKGWLQLKTNKRKIQPMLRKRRQNLVKDSMIRWKWLLYYKHTKRAYLKFKKENSDTKSKAEVFNALKFYRYSVYNLTNKAKAVNNIQVTKLYSFAFNKIRNVGANQRDELNYERKRAVSTLLSTKISRIEIIKRKILHKWHAWLIPRMHYLPSIIKRCELNTLKMAFAMINEKKYWHEYYIKNIADEVTSEGYNQINSVTNSLMREGYDPDEIKQYLKRKNDKDLVIMDKVFKHMRTWSKKQNVVRAFHSWKQYLFLKNNIKKALTKVFNIAGGIGKYWGRWKTKDPHFNEILKRQSRGNMLKRYQQLSRLLKEYHRDIRDNSGNLDELKDINNQYKQKNKMGILMALNSFSGSIKKGMRQGFFIWRDKILIDRRKLMDERYDQIYQGLDMLNQHKGQLRYRIGVMREENKQLKQKCMWGVQCGKILQKLLTEKDSLSIDLADKEHNLKLLLEDNLRLKQKVKMAKSHAQKLIRKVGQQQRS